MYPIFGSSYFVRKGPWERPVDHTKELSFHEHLHDEILYYTTFPAFKMLAMPVSSLVILIPFEDLFDFPMTESSINMKVYILDTMC